MKHHTRKRRSVGRTIIAAGLSAAWIAGVTTLIVTATAAHAF